MNRWRTVMSRLTLVCLAAAAVAAESASWESFFKDVWHPPTEGPTPEELEATRALGAPVCDSYTSCQTCVMFSHDQRGRNCGWCQAENRCVNGDARGPLGENNCTQWDFGFCAGDSCQSYTRPYTCNADPFCIYCLDPVGCIEGVGSTALMGECRRVASPDMGAPEIRDTNYPPVKEDAEEKPCARPANLTHANVTVNTTIYSGNISSLPEGAK